MAGGLEESIFQPEWSPDGALYFVSDRTGWWNLYRLQSGEIAPVCPMDTEFGMPQWAFGMSTYAVESAQRLVCIYTQHGTWFLATIATGTGQMEQIETPFTSVSGLRAVRGRAAFIGGSPTEPSSVVELDLDTRRWAVLRRSSELAIDPGFLSTPQPIEFPTAPSGSPESGDDLTAYALYYAPRNRDYVAPDDERPPLLVISHGGPTGATTSGSRTSARRPTWSATSRTGTGACRPESASRSAEAVTGRPARIVSLTASGYAGGREDPGPRSRLSLETS